MEKVRPIVVIGAGPSGIACALTLDRLVGDDIHQPIYIVSDTETYRLALSVYDVLESGERAVATLPLADIFAGTNVGLIAQRALAIDGDLHTVRTAKRVIRYGDAVVCVGATAAHTESGREYTTSTPSEVVRLGEDLRRLPPHAKHYISIVGGGLKAVEAALAVAAWVRRHPVVGDRARAFPTLVASRSMIANHLPRAVGVELIELLRVSGVALRLQKRWHWDEYQKVKSKLPDDVIHTAIWATGLEARPLLGIHRRGRRLGYSVDPSLRIVGLEDVWAAGSCAETGESATLESAWRQGEFVARQIVRQREGLGIGVYRPQPMAVDVVARPGVVARISSTGVTVGLTATIGAWWRLLRHLLAIVSVDKAASIMAKLLVSRP